MTTTRSAESSRQLDLDAMSLEQLNQLKQSEESRLAVLTNHYATLRASSSRFSTAQKALEEMTLAQGKGNKDIMIPLTESLYVPGKIKDPSKVMVELGTGYFVEKPVKQAHDFLERKAKLVNVNSENLMEVVTVTRKNIESLNVAMNGKMLEIRARQEGMRVREKDQQQQ
jgi:prefoldin, archaeal alpha subunit/eukaryotic subunit 5